MTIKSGPGPVLEHRTEASAQVHWRHEHRGAIISHAQPDTTRTASVPIEINCPAWCEVSPEEHAARLYENEGRCIHQTAVVRGRPRRQTRLGRAPRSARRSSSHWPDNNPAGREVESADVLMNGTESNLEQLLLLATAIADLAALYRETAATR